MPRLIRFARRSDSPGGGALRALPRGRVWVPRAALWMAATAVLTGVALVQLGDSGVPAWRRLRAQDVQLSREVDDLTSRNDELRRELKALREDPETLERLAREVAGMQRPGEEVMRVLPAPENRTE
jgi:cell division protein FtsB